MSVRNKLPLASSGPFSYGSGGFTVDGIPRSSVTELRAILFPQRTRRDPQRLTKKWFAAQLQHYNVNFRSSAAKVVLEEQLKAHITEGGVSTSWVSRAQVLIWCWKQCDYVPESIMAIEGELNQEYEAKCDELKKARLEQFSKIGSPTKEAEFDVDLFLAKYFLDENGQPDRSKTPKPLPFLDFRDQWSLHTAAEKVPGLHTCSGGTDGDARVWVIGWDRNNVRSVAHEIDAEQRAEDMDRAKAECEKKQRHVARRGKAEASRAFKPADAVGAYVVECKSISEEWDNANDLTMNISQGTGPIVLQAEFDFSVLEGVMRLGFDPTLLSICSSSEDEGEDSGEEYNRDSDDEVIVTGTKRKAVGQSAKQAVSKKAKGGGPSAAHPRRLYLQWRGQETGEGVIQLDNSNTGYLEFTDARCNAFKGVASFCFVGEKVKFRGYKVNGGSGRMNKRWSDYSEDKYEDACRARWGGGSRW
jgi:hypothetical protein